MRTTRVRQQKIVHEDGDASELEMKIKNKLVTPQITNNTIHREIIHRSLTGNRLDDRHCGHGTLDTRWPVVSRGPDERKRIFELRVQRPPAQQVRNTLHRSEENCSQSIFSFISRSIPKEKYL